MGDIDKGEIDRQTIEDNNKKAEYISETAKKMNASATSSFWKQLAVAIVVDAIPHIPSIVDNICKLAVPGYVGSRDQQALAFAMEERKNNDTYEQMVGIQKPNSSAIKLVIAHHPREVADALKGAKNIVKDVASATQRMVEGSLVGQLATGVWNKATEIKSSLSKYVVNEDKADPQVPSNQDTKKPRKRKGSNSSKSNSRKKEARFK